MGHDNSGRSPDWYLEEVAVDVPDRDEQYAFPCYRWLVGNEPELELQPGEFHLRFSVLLSLLLGTVKSKLIY